MRKRDLTMGLMCGRMEAKGKNGLRKKIGKNEDKGE